MPRTTVTPTAVPAPYSHVGVDLTLITGDIVNNHQVRLTGKELLLVQNTAGTAGTVTITSAVDAYGRTKDITARSVPAGAITVFEPFQLQGWMQTDGYLYVSVSATTMKLAVLTLP
jgi:hypothetical protein